MILSNKFINNKRLEIDIILFNGNLSFDKNQFINQYVEQTVKLNFIARFDFMNINIIRNTIQGNIILKSNVLSLNNVYYDANVITNPTNQFIR